MCVVNTNAQENKIRYGVKGGGNISDIIGDDVSDSIKGRAGFHIGGFVEIPLSNKFWLQSELMYSKQGFVSEFREEYGSLGSVRYNEIEDERKLHYINIPVLLKYYIANGLNITLGPQLGVLAAAKGEFKLTKAIIENTVTRKLTSVEEHEAGDEFKVFDLGFNFGVGYQLGEHFLVDARYNLGLSEAAEDFDGKNSVFQLSVGYKF